MYSLDYIKYTQKIRETVGEACVLLKNDNNTLPLQNNDVISIFGRSQIETYYCGSGSGGMVNVPYVRSFLEGLSAKRKVNEEVTDLHKKFIEQNPFDKGEGWAMEPFSQKELPLTEEIVKAARAKSSVAVMIIGRLAGEDKDVLPEGGSYYLSKTESENLELLCAHFEKTVVMLNVGGVMDMSFVGKYNPSAVMYAWHGGVESGNGFADLLCGDVNFSGSMPDTVAFELDDYPSTKNFGDEFNNTYEEDIFVGYRYFETFCPQKILYPFGFGLSYTSFELEVKNFSYVNNEVKLDFVVTNTGKVAGKKAVQIYTQSPSVELYQAKKAMCAFAKTKLLNPAESEQISLVINEKDFASFSEKATAFVLEKGEYNFYIGFDCKTTNVAGSFEISEEKIVEQVAHALAPIVDFDRMESIRNGENYEIKFAKAPLRRYDIAQRIAENRKEAPAQTNNAYTFDMVKKGEITTSEFVNDLSDLDLIHMTRGEGMCSPKVTPGTAGCFGAVSENLNKTRKMPIVCCADGPSGIRMDCGTMAMSVPNGTAIASTFNTDLCSELFDFVALEMVKNNVDTLLGPGMNIHRSPLCGRNFEYFSEDPLLTGKMAVAQLKAMHAYGVTGTIKHFALNNQEFSRKKVNATISERAVREVYLRGFEIAVKEGGAYSIMTSYNPINSIHAASNYDLNTVVLRGDWGFEGVVMTDWWATMNFEGQEGTLENTTAMITAQNDVFMVVSDAVKNTMNDNSENGLKDGTLTRSDLVRTGENIINYILRSNCSKEEKTVDAQNVPESEFQNICELGDFYIDETLDFDGSIVNSQRSTLNKFTLYMKEMGNYTIDFKLHAVAGELAQVPMSVVVNRALLGTKTLKGGTAGEFKVEFDMFVSKNVYCELFFGETGMVIDEFIIKRN